VRVLPGNTADPAAFNLIATDVRDKFKLRDMVMVGDRGMITTARIEALRGLGGFGWVTALRAPAIAALAADDGPLQMSLFDQTNLAEITHPDYPDERLVACRNPALATERARKRLALLDATDGELAKVTNTVATGRLAGAAKIGIRVGKVINKYKMEKHYTITITDHGFSFTRDQAAIDAEAAMDGLYVIRTSVGATQMTAGTVVSTYKRLANVERDFRSLKSIDLDLRPIHHHTETRVRAHVFICTLAAYLVWHLRQAWAPLTFTDENKPEPTDPVAPAHRSPAADRKAATKSTNDELPARSFTSLLDHLATLTRNDLRYGPDDTAPIVATLTEPTPVQRRAFQLLDTTIPLNLGK
jgi:transposase